MKRPVVIAIAVLVVLVLAGGAFWGGMNVGKAQAQNDQNAFFASRGFDPNAAGGGGNVTGAGDTAGGAGGQGGQGGARGGFRGTFGTVSKVDGNTITVTDAQGQTVTVTVSDSA